MIFGPGRRASTSRRIAGARRYRDRHRIKCARGRTCSGVRMTSRIGAARYRASRQAGGGLVADGASPVHLASTRSPWRARPSPGQRLCGLSTATRGPPRRSARRARAAVPGGAARGADRGQEQLYVAGHPVRAVAHVIRSRSRERADDRTRAGRRGAVILATHHAGVRLEGTGSSPLPGSPATRGTLPEPGGRAPLGGRGGGAVPLALGSDAGRVDPIPAAFGRLWRETHARLARSGPGR